MEKLYLKKLTLERVQFQLAQLCAFLHSSGDFENQRGTQYGSTYPFHVLHMCDQDLTLLQKWVAEEFETLPKRS